MSTYEDIMDWLMTQLPMFQRQGSANYKIDLSKTQALMAYLDHPERTFKSIHVAGSNGKGSTSHIMASILQADGLKVGLSTSPHMMDFRERIRLNGGMIPKSYVTAFVDDNRTAFESMSLSFFEMATGLAFCYFRDVQVDVAIIEVGMGGRLDSSNVIQPEISVITNISLDHQAFLGNDIGSIAREKAGIIKAGIPVMIGRRQTETTDIFLAKAQASGSDIQWAEDLKAEGMSLPDCDLQGHYQRENTLTAVAALTMQKTWPVSDAAMVYGAAHVASSTGLMGRWQILQQQPYVVADTAHNADGLQASMAQWESVMAGYETGIMVIGMVDDKDVEHMLSFLPPSANLIFCAPSIPRAMPAKALAEIAARCGRPGTCSGTVAAAYELALQQADAKSCIYVGGSSFVVADCLEYLAKKA